MTDPRPIPTAPRERSVPLATDQSPPLPPPFRGERWMGIGQGGTHGTIKTTTTDPTGSGIGHNHA